MALVEINFDGIIGPSHNYAGLSLGNLASSNNAGAASYPRAAALQGIEKMRANIGLGLAQGFFMPLDRPNQNWLTGLATDMQSAEPHIRAAAFSASAMWAANAATVSPGPDTADGKCHLSAANLLTMAHRSHEWTGTLAQLQMAFANERHFAVHGPVPAPFGDEGAANFLRLCASHDAAGVEIFVYGKTGGPFPARQHIEASKAIARAHRLDPAKTLFVQQSEAAIAAGAFHNDVVAVAMNACFSRMSTRSSTQNRSMPMLNGLCLRQRSSSYQRTALASQTPFKAIYSMRSWLPCPMAVWRLFYPTKRKKMCGFGVG